MLRRAGKGLFPYEPRPNQRVIMDHISAALERSGHVIAESGTGSGKTICSLAPALEYALAHGRKVLYLTRTNSQQKQVIMELRRIQARQKIFGIGMQGRQNTCPLLDDRPDLKKGTAEELSRVCGDLKRASMEGGAGCRYYDALLGADLEAIRKEAESSIPTVEEFMELCRDRGGVCPYEASKMLLADASVVTAPYIYFFSPVIRRSLLDWMQSHVSDLIVIVDEAHNLTEYARDLYSKELSVRALELAALEAEDIGDPALAGGMKLAGFCRLLQEMVLHIASEYVAGEDGLVPPGAVQEWLMSAIRGTSRDMQVMLANMLTHGDIIRERRRRAGKLPRSHIYRAASFLQDWTMLDDIEYARLVVGGDNPRLEAYCLNPAMATGVLNDCHSSIHLSGTLRPVDEYRDSIGLPPDTDCLQLPSPFSRDNRLVLYTPDFTTKYETLAREGKELIPRMKGFMREVMAAVPRNTIIFFPSFSLMSDFADVANGLGREVYFEEQGMTQEELMCTVRDFKLAEGAVMLAVMGGRISEGIDFPDRELELAILVGIPYPRPTAKQGALMRYYDMRFGRGWDYTVKSPAVRKMLQSMGRLLRRESDRGVALVLDGRMAQLRTEIPEARQSAEPLADILRFFEASG